jgi:hypothetical protein
MRSLTICFTAICAALSAGCDPGIYADELDSPLRPISTYDGAGLVAPGCEVLAGVTSGDLFAVPHPDDPGLVIVQLDGEPICVDTRDRVAEQADKLGLHIPVPAMPPSGNYPLPDPPAAGEERPGGDLVTSNVGDDPIPLGKSDRPETQGGPTK